MEKLKIPYPVIVEGRYDKATLASVIDANIIATDGFAIFKKQEKSALIRRLASCGKIIVLTDSDGAGGVIRSHIAQMIPKDRLIHLYIPRIAGKEKRKKDFSAEGTLGVEGMDAELLRKLFEPFVNQDAVELMSENPLSKTDFYIDGLSGGEGSAARRDEIARKLSLPTGMTANALLCALKMICPYEKYLELVGRRENLAAENENKE